MGKKTKKVTKKLKVQPSVLCDLFSNYEEVHNDECGMLTVDNRKKTFNNWLLGDDCSCNPLSLAEAGFYHIPTVASPDATRCFFCYKELDGWEPDDDPKKEHKKHSPNCAFLGLKMPIEYLTVDAFLQLDCERQKNKARKFTHARLQEFENLAVYVREEMQKLNPQ